MKRFWLVLLSLGLIVAFSTSAMALDVKFSGEYYAGGLYLDKTNFNKAQWGYAAITAPKTVIPALPGGGTLVPAKTFATKESTAFYFQRLRIGAQFVVSPGLSLITRADIMERAWGATRSSGTAVSTNPFTGGVTGASAALDTLSAGTRAENENIAFDLLYVSYASPIGLFNVGYQIDGAWGTVFGDSSMPTGKIAYYLPIGSFGVGLQMGKNNNGEGSKTAINDSFNADLDDGFYTAFVRYAAKNMEAGLLVKHIRNNKSRNMLAAYAPVLAGYAAVGVITAAEATSADAGNTVQQYAVVPYFKGKFGPLAVQAEFTWATGKVKWEGNYDKIPTIAGFLPGPQQDADLNAYNGWLDLVADFGVGYVGGTFAHMSGDDYSSLDKIEGGLTGGQDWNPCLIMFNNDLTYWAGAPAGYGGWNSASGVPQYTTAAGPMNNAWFYQIRGGVRPIDKLDIMLSYSYATADKTPAAQWQGRTYGQEIDLTANYKITNNLSYMLGGGYVMVGDWFKGVNAAGTNEVDNDFLIINKLTLTF
jgi:hypothetical protein